MCLHKKSALLYNEMSQCPCALNTSEHGTTLEVQQFDLLAENTITYCQPAQGNQGTEVYTIFSSLRIFFLTSVWKSSSTLRNESIKSQFQSHRGRWGRCTLQNLCWLFSSLYSPFIEPLCSPCGNYMYFTCSHPLIQILCFLLTVLFYC